MRKFYVKENENEYEEIKDLIQADIDYKNKKNIVTFNSIEELDEYFKI